MGILDCVSVAFEAEVGLWIVFESWVEFVHPARHTVATRGQTHVGSQFLR